MGEGVDDEDPGPGCDRVGDGFANQGLPGGGHRHRVAAENGDPSGVDVVAAELRHDVVVALLGDQRDLRDRERGPKELTPPG